VGGCGLLRVWSRWVWSHGGPHPSDCSLHICSALRPLAEHEGTEVQTAGDVQAPYPAALPVAPHPGHGTICRNRVQHQYLLGCGTHRQAGLCEYLLDITHHPTVRCKAIFGESQQHQCLWGTNTCSQEVLHLIKCLCCFNSLWLVHIMF
jgi:hypothetical protein